MKWSNFTLDNFKKIQKINIIENDLLINKMNNDKKNIIKLLNQKKPYLNYNMHLKDFKKIISQYYIGNIEGNTNRRENSKIIARSLFIFLQKLFRYEKN